MIEPYSIDRLKELDVQVGSLLDHSLLRHVPFLGKIIRRIFNVAAEPFANDLVQIIEGAYSEFGPLDNQRFSEFEFKRFATDPAIAFSFNYGSRSYFVTIVPNIQEKCLSYSFVDMGEGPVGTLDIKSVKQKAKEAQGIPLGEVFEGIVKFILNNQILLPRAERLVKERATYLEGALSGLLKRWDIMSAGYSPSDPKLEISDLAVDCFTDTTVLRGVEARIYREGRLASGAKINVGITTHSYLFPGGQACVFAQDDNLTFTNRMRLAAPEDGSTQPRYNGLIIRFLLQI